MYESWMLFGQNWKVRPRARCSTRAPALRDGDTIPRLVGYEYDRTIELDTPSPVGGAGVGRPSSTRRGSPA